jgi:hypothetical protein
MGCSSSVWGNALGEMKLGGCLLAAAAEATEAIANSDLNRSAEVLAKTFRYTEG